MDYESHAVALDRNELGALLVAAGLGPPTEHALISLLALNGLRVSEATGADIEHLGLERGHRTLTITRKGGKMVTVPLAPRTARAIDLAIGERTGGPVFLAADGRRLDRHGATGRLSIRAVAAEAGITPPAVYRVFPDRRALIRATVETCFDRFEAHLARASQGVASPFEALRQRCRAYVAFGASQPHLYRVMFGAWSAGPKALGTYGRHPHPGADAFTGLIASIQRCLNAGAQTRRSSPFLAVSCGPCCTA